MTGANLIADVGSACVVTYEIEDVPNAKFYSIKIGTHEGPAWSRDDLAARDFEIDLALGDQKIPEADNEAFCAEADALRQVFSDLKLLNNNSFRWDARIRESRDPFLDFAGGLILEGGDAAEMADEVVSAADTLKKINGYEAAAPLTRSIQPLNDAMYELYAAFDCGYWEPVSYAAAG